MGNLKLQKGCAMNGKSKLIKNLARVIVFLVGISMMAMSLTSLAYENPVHLGNSDDESYDYDIEPEAKEYEEAYRITPSSDGNYEPIGALSNPPDISNVELEVLSIVAMRRTGTGNTAAAFEPHPDRQPGTAMPGDYVAIVVRFDTNDVDNLIVYEPGNSHGTNYNWHIFNTWSEHFVWPFGGSGANTGALDTSQARGFGVAGGRAGIDYATLSRRMLTLADRSNLALEPFGFHHFPHLRVRYQQRIGAFGLQAGVPPRPGYIGAFYFQYKIQVRADAPLGTQISVGLSLGLERDTPVGNPNYMAIPPAPADSLCIRIGVLCDECDEFLDDCICCEVCGYHPDRCICECEECGELLSECKCCEKCEEYPCTCECEVCGELLDDCKCCEDCGEYPCGCRILQPQPPNRDALREAIRNANAIERGRHTSATWNAFIAALERAQAVYANPNATQAEIDAAKRDLLTVKGALLTYPSNNQANVTTGAAPRTGDAVAILPLLAGFLLSMSSVLGGTSLRRKLKK